MRPLEWTGPLAILMAVIALITHKGVFGYAMLASAVVYAVYVTIRIARGDE